MNGSCLRSTCRSLSLKPHRLSSWWLASLMVGTIIVPVQLHILCLLVCLLDGRDAILPRRIDRCLLNWGKRLWLRMRMQVAPRIMFSKPSILNQAISFILSLLNHNNTRNISNCLSVLRDASGDQRKMPSCLIIHITTCFWISFRPSVRLCSSDRPGRHLYFESHFSRVKVLFVIIIQET